MDRAITGCARRDCRPRCPETRAQQWHKAWKLVRRCLSPPPSSFHLLRESLSRHVSLLAPCLPHTIYHKHRQHVAMLLRQIIRGAGAVCSSSSSTPARMLSCGWRSINTASSPPSPPPQSRPLPRRPLSSSAAAAAASATTSPPRATPPASMDQAPPAGVRVCVMEGQMNAYIIKAD